MALFSRFSLTFPLLLLTAISAFAQTKFTSDQQKILKEAVRVAVSDPDFLNEYPELVSDKKTVVIYDKMASLEQPDKTPDYLTEKMLPKIKGVKLNLQTQKEIYNPERREDLVFLRIMQFDQPEGEYAIVTVLSQIALGSESREKGYLHKQSTGKTMLLKKNKKNWQFEKVVNTLPNLVDYNLPY